MSMARRQSRNLIYCYSWIDTKNENNRKKKWRIEEDWIIGFMSIVCHVDNACVHCVLYFSVFLFLPIGFAACYFWRRLLLVDCRIRCAKVFHAIRKNKNLRLLRDFGTRVWIKQMTIWHNVRRQRCVCVQPICGRYENHFYIYAMKNIPCKAECC